MSSPLAKRRRSIFDRILVKVHQASSHSHRIEKIASVISDILATQALGPHAKLLDIGCGDMSLSRSLLSKRPDLSVVGIDVYPLPDHLQRVDEWRAYRQFNGQLIPYDNGHFDLGILCDVLHHVNPKEQQALVKEGLRTCKFLIIKDHFEFGWPSRQILRSMDFLGNFGYGVSIPKQYFTEQSLTTLAKGAGGTFTILVPQIDLYSHLPVVRSLTNKNWQFVGLIE